MDTPPRHPLRDLLADVPPKLLVRGAFVAITCLGGLLVLLSRYADQLEDAWRTNGTSGILSLVEATAVRAPPFLAIGLIPIGILMFVLWVVRD